MGVKNYAGQSGWKVVEEERVKNPKQAKRRARRATKRRRRKKRGLAQLVTRWFVAAVLLAAVYCVLVFSNIPFIEKWRTIYIETAMGTMNHQWLATRFLPQTVIDDVMKGRMAIELQQEEYNSAWGAEETAFPSHADAVGSWKTVKKHFSEQYPEIDQASLKKYLEKHKNKKLLDKDGCLLIDRAAYDEEKTGIKTIYGDDVCAIDTHNGIVIVSLDGDGYAGRMAIVKNSEQVRLATAPNLGSAGSYLDRICEKNDAVLGINASGFSDPEGTGNGGEAFGMILSKEKLYRKSLDTTMKVIGLDKKNHLEISNTLPDGARDAMQFSPALVVNGEQLISGSSGWGLQPRSVIGQTKDGEMLLAIVDGRQPGLFCRHHAWRFGGHSVSVRRVSGVQFGRRFVCGHVLSRPHYHAFLCGKFRARTAYSGRLDCHRAENLRDAKTPASAGVFCCVQAE